MSDEELYEVWWEVWRQVKGWPGYEVSSYGRVRSPRKILKQGKNQMSGYKQVWLMMEKKCGFSVHALVANAFVLNPREDIFDEVDHIDGNHTNNVHTNLRWVNNVLNQLNRTMARGWMYFQSDNRKKPYQVQFRHKHVGYFATAEEAHARYKQIQAETFAYLYNKLVDQTPSRSHAHDP